MIGKDIQGYKNIKSVVIPEINGTAHIFEHIKTEAKLIYLENDDDNKVFQIAFRTPSANSTGVAHILEHSVLCGSRKYPLKEPFVELAKGSLKTFLNAMTYPDKTVYPIASTNDKDFMNLMDVYLDAVFYPNIYSKPNIFKQEGWHYHLENKNDEITYNGVVYNEMKGVYSNPEDLLQYNIAKALYPDTIYGYESGGHPENIIDLTYEDFLDFHKKFYHPSNAYIYFYGDGDINYHLKFIDENYLSNFDKKQIDSRIKAQSTNLDNISISVPYPLSKGENLIDKDYLSLSYVLTDTPVYEDILAFDILSHILLNSNASPLKKALLDLNICKEVYYSLSSSLKQPCFSIVLKNTSIKNERLLIETVENTLKDLVKNDIDKKAVLAGINITEFSLIEGEYGTYPRGLMLGLEIMETWLYDGDPLTHLRYTEAIKHLRESADNRGFEGLIERYLLRNPHRVSVCLYPDQNLAERYEANENKVLGEVKSSLGECGIKTLIDETGELVKFQNEVDSEEALKSIPKLNLSEIDKEPRNFPIEELMVGNNRVLFHKSTTKDIVYYKFYFDTNRIAKDDLKYLSILNKVMGSISTKRYTYEALNREIEIYTGGIFTSLETIGNTKMCDDYTSNFTVKGKATTPNINKLLDLIETQILESKFDEKSIISNILSENRMSKESQFLTAGHIVAVHRLQSYYSQSARLFEEIGGYNFYKFLAHLDDNYATSFEFLSHKLSELIKRIFSRENLTISITCEEKTKKLALNSLENFLEKLENKQSDSYVYNFIQKDTNEGFMTPAKIQYVAQGYNIKKLGFEYKGSMQVLKLIMSMDYLWNKVRVLGGAYGASMGIDKSGELYFASYRDPNLGKTLDIYKDSYKYLQKIDISQRELDKYIIGTISSKDVPLSSAITAEMADTMYFNKTSPEELQIERDEILSTSLRDIRKSAYILEEVMKKNNICVFGNEEKIKEEGERFNSIKYTN